MGDLEKNGLICVKQNLKKFVSKMLPVIEQNIYSKAADISERLVSSSSRNEIFEHVCSTTLMSHFNPSTCKFLAQFIISSLPAVEGEDEFIKELTYLIDNFFTIIIKVPNRAYSECAVFQPLLIKHRVKRHDAEMQKSGATKCVLLKNGIDHLKAGENSSEMLHLRNGQITKLLLVRRKNVESFATRLQAKQVTLILCTEQVPDYATDILQRYDISVIPFVSEESVEVLEHLTKKYGISSVHDTIEASNIMDFKGVMDVSVGGQAFTQLEIAHQTSWKHLIICGPTAGLCDQVAIMCQKALISLRRCFVDKSIFEQVIPLSENDGDCDTVNCSYQSPDGMSANCALNEGQKKYEQVKQSKSVFSESNDGHENLKSLTNAGGITREKDSGNSKSNTQKETPTKKLCLFPGGGSVEMMLWKLLQDMKSSSSNVFVTSLCECLKKMCMGFIKNLHESTRIDTRNKRDFIETWSKLESKVNTGELWGLDRRGNATDLLTRNVMEPIQSKLHILSCVLSLVEQLINVDRFVSVKSLPQEEDKETDSDSERD